MKKGNLILIPSLLGGSNYSYCMPPDFKKIISGLKYFIVEDIRTARRFLKPAGFVSDFEEVTFSLLNKHTEENTLNSYLEPALNGHNIGLISEAGTPCIADPGSQIVSIAHHKKVRVIPLVGPSSIILALMASGFNGQNFAFLGYLPVKSPERKKKIKEIELEMYRKNQTQIFIETPYRNQSLLSDILDVSQKDTRLCIAADLTLPTELITTLSITEWKKNIPELHKRLVVFLLFK
ncbi:MAG: SAM-dependent methyltransferase [Bacteroidales bacterium]|nr:SAM-dependent methyltransferase [Bacteroidales bacterium]